MAPSLPSNVTVPDNATYASLLAKLREPSLPSSEVRSLVAQLTTLLTQSTELGVASNETLAVVVVLRSGLSMFEPLLATIPKISTVTYHLGIFRDKHNLQPVEYYNKLPPKPASVRRAVVIDPVIATGGTAAAVVNILKDWGIEEITFLSILASRVGARRVAEVWPESTRFILGAIDADVDAKGYIQPGVGDIGDRLFGTDLK